MIHDLDTNEQQVIEIESPWTCASSQSVLAVTTVENGLHLFSTQDSLVHIVPDSMDASCVAFHPRNTNILAIGYGDGTVCFWDMSSQTHVSEFTHHSRRITNIRLAHDGRLFLSSIDNTASIVTLDDQFQFVSSVKFKGHTNWVFDIMPLYFRNQCVTCSEDMTLKVWDCETGACLRTLSEHTDSVISLAIHSNRKHFASGSHDGAVIIWSCETFEVLRSIFTFPSGVQSIALGENDILYVGVYGHGVLSCNSLTGEVGPVIIPATKTIRSLAFGRESLCTRQKTHHSCS